MANHMTKKEEQQWRAAAPPGPAAKLTVLVLLVAEHRLQEGGAGCSRASRATQLYSDNTLQLAATLSSVSPLSNNHLVLTDRQQA